MPLPSVAPREQSLSAHVAARNEDDMADTLVLQNATIFDSTGAEPYGPGIVVVTDDQITAVGPASQVTVPRDARVIDAGNHTVMPGLIDAHTHVGAVENSFGANFEDRHPGAIYAFSVARILRETLMAGFTTIRDAGGCDYSFKTGRGVRNDPGAAHIHQPGLHLPDRRPRRHASAARTAPIPGRAIGWRRGLPFATAYPRCVRQPGSNCAPAPTSSKSWPAGERRRPPTPLDSPQFTVEEIAAAVYEAKAVKKRVMAHVYVPEGIKNCVGAGVRSIEHGNFLDEEAASLMKENDMYLVPTLTVFELVAERGREQGISELTIEKINFARGAGRQSVEIAMAAGVNIASGADLFGQNYGLKAMELQLKAAVMGPIASLVSATRTNAELLERSNEIGTLEPGKQADLIMVSGNPVDDITILQDEKNIPLVVQNGRVVKWEEPG